MPRKSPAPPLAAEQAQWRDSNRFAEFIANVIGGVFVVVGVSSYVAAVLQNAVTTAPNPSEFIITRANRLIAFLALDKELPACLTLTPTNGFSSLLGCFDLLNERSEDGALLRERWRLLAATSAAIGLVTIVRKSKWIGWYMWLQLGVIVQWIIALYQFLRIAMSLAVYMAVKTVKWVAYSTRHGYIMVFGIKQRHAVALRYLMKQANTRVEWSSMAEYLDKLEDREHWKAQILPEDYDHCDFTQLAKNTQDLKDAIDTRNIDALKYILASFVMRNKLGIDSADIHLASSTGTKRVIEKYMALVVQGLEALAKASEVEFPSHEKNTFFHKLKQSFGSSALCLSGGGAIAMYHMGVMKALLEADLLPNVISGSSGGSIAAAMAACKNNHELIDTVIQRDISTRYFDLGIRWFPPFLRQLAHCVKTGFLVHCYDFERTTQHYYGEPFDSFHKTMHYTFQDAFLKTGRHVCITVSASDVTGHKGPKKLLLNHMNTPHVLLWSAVAVSCSLPGIMKGKKLMARDHEGNVVPYDAMGKEWVDGSIQHDLPMETMASCFNVTNFLVSQVNPHVVPFVGDDVHQPSFRKSLFHTLESVIAADVRHRLKMLAFLGLFPRIYGHQFSSYFKQNFSGNVTVIPDFIFSEAIGIKAILNPTREDMDRYIKGGERAVWPKLAYISHLCAIEKCLDRCLSVQLLPHFPQLPVLYPSKALTASHDAKTMRYENWLHPLSTERSVAQSVRSRAF